MAPVAFLNYVKSPVRALAPLCNSFTKARLLFAGNMGEFLPSSKITRLLADTVCTSIIEDLPPIICSNFVFLLMGYDKANMNAVRLLL